MAGRIKKRQDNRTGQPPLIGKLKVGELVKRGNKSFPKGLDYFRATGSYSVLFHQEVGEKPSSVQIVFPSSDVEKVCNERWTFRDQAGKLVSYGDGQEFFVHDPETNEYVPYVGDLDKITKRFEEKGQVELTLRFYCISFKSVFGLWELTTKGTKSSIDQIIQSFDMVLEKNGTVEGVVFDLSVKLHKSNKPNDKSRYPVVSLVARPDLSLGEVKTLQISEGK